MNLRRTLCPILLTLAGCAVGPDYRAPETAVEPGFATADAGLSQAAVELEWWKRFGDRTLTELVRDALANNRDLKAAEVNLLGARALYLQAGLDLAPVVTSHANYNDQKRSLAALNNRNFVPRQLKLFSTGFDATWELDLFGRLRRNLEAREGEVEAEVANIRDLRVSLIGEVARNYVELRGLQHQLAVTRQNGDNQAATLDLTRVRLEAGRGTELDTSRAQAQLETTRATLPPLEASIRQAIHRLGVLTGRQPAALIRRLAQPAPLPRSAGPIRIGSPAELLRRRPDIRRAERSLAAATARIGVATADLFPRVTFVGSIAFEAKNLSGLGAAGSDAYSMGPRISWEAFDLGHVYARIEAADAQARSLLAQYEQAVLNALEETENALVNYVQQRNRYALLVSAAAASARARDLADLRYREGASDFLPVLDAERTLLLDQEQLAQSETSMATAVVALYKSLGGGWQEPRQEGRQGVRETARNTGS